MLQSLRSQPTSARRPIRFNLELSDLALAKDDRSDIPATDLSLSRLSGTLSAQIAHTKERTEAFCEAVKEPTQIPEVPVSEPVSVEAPWRKQFRTELWSERSRFVQLLRAWDEDQQGTLTKSMLKMALHAVGIEMKSTALQLIFDALEPDEQGVVAIETLEDVLQLQAFGAGDRRASQRPSSSSPRSRGSVERSGARGGARASIEQMLEALRVAVSRRRDRFDELLEQLELTDRISAAELRGVLALLGLRPHRRLVEALFALLDANATDGGGVHSDARADARAVARGTVSCAALRVWLQPRPHESAMHGGDAMEAEAPTRGHALMNELSPPARHAPRRRAAPKRRDCAFVRAAERRSGEGRLRRSLVEHWTHALALFRLWDTQGRGFVSAADFERALTELGISKSAEHAASLFAALDTEDIGEVDYNVLDRQIRLPPPPKDECAENPKQKLLAPPTPLPRTPVQLATLSDTSLPPRGQLNAQQQSFGPAARPPPVRFTPLQSNGANLDAYQPPPLALPTPACAQPRTPLRAHPHSQLAGGLPLGLCALKQPQLAGPSTAESLQLPRRFGAQCAPRRHSRGADLKWFMQAAREGQLARGDIARHGSALSQTTQELLNYALPPPERAAQPRRASRPARAQSATPLNGRQLGKAVSAAPDAQRAAAARGLSSAQLRAQVRGLGHEPFTPNTRPFSAFSASATQALVEAG